jgi:hypothetical protein
MTTSQSPLRALKMQADNIAKVLKAYARGETMMVQFAEKMEAARDKPSITFAVAMDDKIVKIEMPWTVMRDTSEVGLAEYILKQMRGSREATH